MKIKENSITNIFIMRKKLKPKKKPQVLLIKILLINLKTIYIIKISRETLFIIFL